MQLKIILTGATGFVGEGVLMECLSHPDIKEVLMVNRKHLALEHPKLKELILPDFMQTEEFSGRLAGYDACFYCAGISSVGLNEAAYSYITYDITIHFAKQLLALNPDMIFNFISGSHTDSSEKGKVMWARVKGRTENALATLPFKKEYNFRPGFMKPTPGQKNVKRIYRVIGKLYPLLRVVFPNNVSRMQEVGLAMINALKKGYPKQILEVTDIKALANG